jgi:23S rRNA pseudouridine2604 synthase
MRVKLTAKHPRSASPERAPVRSGSATARKPVRPTGPRPATPRAGERDAGATGAGKRTGADGGAGSARPARAEGSFSRSGDGKRASSDRPPRREGASETPRRAGDAGGGRSERAPRRFEGERSEWAPRRFEGERTERAPRRFEGERTERAPRRFEGERTERAPRRFEGERTERAPRRFEGERTDRAPRRFEGERTERAPRRFEGERTERAPRRFEGERTERAPRRFEGERTERAPRRFEGERTERAPRHFEGERTERAPRRFDNERPARAADAERGRFERPARDSRDEGARRPFDRPTRDDSPRRGATFTRGERSAPTERRSFERSERTFAKPVKSGYGERTERPSREDRPPRPTSAREFGDRPPRGDRPARPARSDETAPRASAPRREHDDAPGTLRLSKLMSELGLCSRREADEWIENGWVRVDGEKIDTLGTKVRPDQRIEIDPAAEAMQARQVTILLHKPVGYVSGQAEDGYQPAITLVTPENRWEGDRSDIKFSVSHLRQLAPAGRLDIDSTGLLVLTQDGRIAKRLIGGHSEVEKEYLVRVTYGDVTTEIDQHFPPESLALLRHGLELDEQPLKPAKVSWQNGEQLRFVLREGKKRQIRRMCELVGLEVVGLKRVRMGSVPLGALPPGQWRYLDQNESF